MKVVQTDFYIPIKVYYVEEDDDPLEIEVVSKTSSASPKYQWTLSTTVNESYNPKNPNSSPYKTFDSTKCYSEATASSDGTMLFWYDKNSGKFCTKLIDEEGVKRKALSEEMKVRITLYDGGRISGSDTVTLIKNGPPRSYCQIFFDNRYISLDDDTLTLFIKTKYTDFDDEDIVELRKNKGEDSFPYYKIKDEDIIISVDETVANTGEIAVKKIEELKEVDVVSGGEFNGYIAKVKIAPKKAGQIKVDVNLVTEYGYTNHEADEVARKYSAVLGIGEEPQVSLTTTPTTTPQSTPPKKASLAGVGGVVILLAIFVGMKLFGRR